MLLYNKCPLSLFRMSPDVTVMSLDLLLCLQASVGTNSVCACCPGPGEHRAMTSMETERERASVSCCSEHCIPCQISLICAFNFGPHERFRCGSVVECEEEERSGSVSHYSGTASPAELKDTKRKAKPKPPLYKAQQFKLQRKIS